MNDRLFDLLPAVIRLKDAEQGWPLRSLLGVIDEQVDVVEQDVAQLYENWFIETADDWVVPYIGELVGYTPVHDAGKPGDVATEQGRARNRILVPRREVANTIGYRRRKGTLPLLELLARDAAGWPARAVEFYRLLAVRQNVNMVHVRRGRIADMRWGDALDLLDGPFDRMMHTAEVRRIGRRRDPGRYNIPNVGVFVWRLRSYSVTRAPAHAAEDVGPHAFTFSALANDQPLFNRPEPEPLPTTIAQERNVPGPIRRRALERDPEELYGEGRSFEIWTGSPPQPVPASALVAADLSGWVYRPKRGQVAVDPVLGRIAFPPAHAPKRGLTVSYRYGFSADMGAGEYPRTLTEPAGATRYLVGTTLPAERGFRTITDALEKWREEHPRDAVIEIVDSGVYPEQIEVELDAGTSLQIRAASGTRPVIRLLDWRTDRSDALLVSGGEGSRFTIDGFVVTGRGLQVEGDVACVRVRHTTLVPGWGLEPDCRPRRPNEASLVLVNTDARVDVEHSIIGSILVIRDDVRRDPERIFMSDSILDATDARLDAITGSEMLTAHARLTIVRSTVIGEVRTHAIDLAENAIFMSHVSVARRQIGCMRFSYVPPGSRTPRRFHCQPDLVEEAVRRRKLQPVEEQREIANERQRVRPTFTSTRYGNPAYCQLASTCAVEITTGADDESEMGAFHDLFQPQRTANLRVRLDEFSPAGMEAGIIFVT